MCGIIGLLGHDKVTDRLMSGLQRMEYRGYDSAGIAVLAANGTMQVQRATGKLENLRQVLAQHPTEGVAGIGHIRWATHGRADLCNAHPHVSGGVAVVHNGIIENFSTLRAQLQQQGRVFLGDTDTEVVAHLADIAFAQTHDPVKAAFRALDQLQGAFALVFLFEGYPDILIGARQGSPLAVGYGEGENAFGSDAAALSPLTRTISYLEEGDRCILTRSEARFFDASGNSVTREPRVVDAANIMTDKEPYRHFMEKEIYEQPEAVARTLAPIMHTNIDDMALALDDPFAQHGVPQRLILTGCGTAYYAALTAQYWFEQLAGISVVCDLASEWRYRDMPLRAGDMLLCISQSGETADTLAACRYALAQGIPTVGLVNVAESTLARECDKVLYTRAGVEVGVASTKAFTCQLAGLLPLALLAAYKNNRLSAAQAQPLLEKLRALPRLLNETLQQVAPLCAQYAQTLAAARDVMYLGRGTLYPAALEGALKLKEITYIHAEGYAAGEIKHGPIALIDDSVPVVIVAPSNTPLFDKTISAMHEVKARGAQIILLTDAAGAAHAAHEAQHTIVVPDAHLLLAPLLYAVPLQLLAYNTALLRGTDADRPRNLAKSVTVE